MSDRGRGAPRGGPRGGSSSSRGGGSSGRGGGRPSSGNGGGGAGAGPSKQHKTEGAPQQREERKKEVILDLAKFVDKRIRVKFQGGREVQGVLKGYDQLMNLVMDDVTEYLAPAEGEETPASGRKTRQLGLAVLRGTALTIISPADGFEQIANPFVSAE